MKLQQMFHQTIIRCLAFALAIAVIAPVLTLPVTVSAGLSEMPYRLVPGMTSSIGVDLNSLATSGSLIVWEDHRAGSPDVYVYDQNDGREFRASSVEETRRSPAVHESTIIWISGDEPEARDVRGVNLAEGTEFDLTDEPARVANPAISSGAVAWQQRVDDRWMIHVFDRSSSDIDILGQDAENSARPDASGQNVVWQEHDGTSWNIQRFDTESGWPSSVTDSPHDDQYPAISESHIAFIRTPQDGGPPQLIVTDLDGGDERILESEHYVQRPAIHGRMVVWEDWRSGLPDIYAYDLDENETFAVARSQQASAPAVSDSFVAWISGNDPARQRVHGMEIRDRLPTDPQDPPAVPSPDALYVTATQQFVSSGFKSFWQANGGPQIFGYPLTSEFTEEHPDTGERIIVQYFERVKLEFHPDEPEDSRIRVALLGYEQVPDHEPEPAEPAENDDVSRYFPETGQSLSYGFKQFWEENGGLEIFGFPITGEFTENGRTVQYFERARFELDSESRPSQVQIGLLGREALQERGWLPPPPVDTTQIFE